MSTRKLERLRLDPLIVEKLSSHGIQTVQEFFNTSPYVLMSLANISMQEVSDMISLVSERICPKSSNALVILHELKKKTRFISTGIASLDVLMKGGLLIGSINEICGPPGIGKTQFSLNCVLQASGHNNAVEGAASRGVIYIDTEQKFDPSRLVEMAVGTFPEIYGSEYRIDAAHRIDTLLGNVTVW
jgi:RAD51-like protein 1